MKKIISWILRSLGLSIVEYRPASAIFYISPGDSMGRVYIHTGKPELMESIYGHEWFGSGQRAEIGYLSLSNQDFRELMESLPKDKPSRVKITLLQ